MARAPPERSTQQVQLTRCRTTSAIMPAQDQQEASVKRRRLTAEHKAGAGVSTPTAEGDNSMQVDSSPDTSAALAVASPNDGTSAAKKPRASSGSNLNPKVSCMPCRRSKVRCSGPMDDGNGSGAAHPDTSGSGAEETSACERCRKTGRECFYKEHQRGRPRKYPVGDPQSKSARSASSGGGGGGAAGGAYRGSRPSVSSGSLDNGYDSSGYFAGGGGDPDGPSGSSAYHRANGSGFSSQDSPGESAIAAAAASAALQAAALSGADEAHFARYGGDPGSSTGGEGERGGPSRASEEDEHGLPALSNPLRLLASASMSHADQQMSSHDPNHSHPNSRSHSRTRSQQQQQQQQQTNQLVPPPPPAPAPGASLPVGDAGSSAGGTSAGEGSSGKGARTGARGSAASNMAVLNHLSLGLYSERLDLEPRFDPIKITGEAQAKLSLNLFLDHINGPLTLLDRNLYTFDYLRRRSHGLLAVICALSTKFMQQANVGITSHELDEHIRTNVIPAIMLDGYRSVELMHALIILAAYHPATPTLLGDRSWSFLGAAIRMGAELDMNSKMLSLTHGSNKQQANGGARANGRLPQSLHEDEMMQRKLRNRERAWLNAWLFEQSLSAHTGRRPTLGLDPVVLSCDRWYQAQHAIPEDEAIVAIVQLRRTIASLTERYESSFASTNANPGSGSTDVSGHTMLVDLFRRACESELVSWRSRWCATSGAPSETPKYLDQTPTRLRNGPLYYHYGALLLHSFVLRDKDIERDALRPSYLAAYTHATSYLQEFLRTQMVEKLVYAHNSTIVTACYCAVFALRLITTSSREERGVSDFADVDASLRLVTQLSSVLTKASKGRHHGTSVLGSYAAYLKRIIQRFEETRSAGEAQLSQPQAPNQQPYNPQQTQQQVVPPPTSESSNFVPPPPSEGWATGTDARDATDLSGLDPVFFKGAAATPATSLDGVDGSLGALDRFLTEWLDPPEDLPAGPGAGSMEDWLTM